MYGRLSCLFSLGSNRGRLAPLKMVVLLPVKQWRRVNVCLVNVLEVEGFDLCKLR